MPSTFSPQLWSSLARGRHGSVGKRQASSLTVHRGHATVGPFLPQLPCARSSARIERLPAEQKAGSSNLPGRTNTIPPRYIFSCRPVGALASRLIGYVVTAVKRDTSAGVTLRELDIEADSDHIAISHNVVFPLKAQQPFVPGRCQRPAADERLIGHHLCLDESMLQVGVNRPGGL